MPEGPQDSEDNEGEGEEGRSPPAKRARTSCGFDDKQTDMLQEVLRMIQQQNERIETVLRENQELREKLSSLTTVINGVGGYHQQFPAPSKDKYSTHKIEADDEKPPQGDRHRLLEEKGIKTVEDFLSFYRKSPDGLRKEQEFTLVAFKRAMCLTNTRQFLEAMAAITFRDHAQRNQVIHYKFQTFIPGWVELAATTIFFGVQQNA
ncbi:hypothetical protein E2562_019724 [Oryza meyeriana var. granulata]|uniref:Uncharacterized protein n=1 Tax=Oryza meyeriana var. granulata TaxID=110450 RepID=A0A6G1C7R7_9ORYZ|nr:hypothetical protein E2562_019724 [Oryza meyeriana var. granulata]